LILSAAFFVSYLVGSIPTAYLFVRHKAGVDIRKAGSGNVGAFNTYDVTQSKISGVIVGFLDALKGFIVTAILVWVIRAPFDVLAVGFLGVVVGHNYPVWLKFKGGRGLATAAGGFFAIGVMYTLVWCTLWFVVYRIRKDIHTGNLFAIIVTPILVTAMPASWLDALMISDATPESFKLISIGLSVLLFLSHIDVVKEFFQQRKIRNE
jgi:glycerol-3-phosphate acyltransferase PlsY